MQENWIGRRKGLRLTFPFAGAPPRASTTASTVYTTRPDTLFGASFVGARRPTIRWPSSWPRPIRAAAAFIAECRKGGTSEAEIETAEKLGFDTGPAGRRTRSTRTGRCRSGSRTSS